MKGVEQRHYRVNFIAIHWYGADFQTGAAVAQLKSYLESVHHRYDLPVWLTEYALIDFTAAARSTRRVPSRQRSLPPRCGCWTASPSCSATPGLRCRRRARARAPGSMPPAPERRPPGSPSRA